MKSKLQVARGTVCADPRSSIKNVTAGSAKLFAALETNQEKNNLVQLIKRALNAIGESEGSEAEAKRIVGELQAMYVKTIDDLNAALKDCAKDVRKIIKGLLFTKVLEELKSSEKKQLWKTIASAATSGPAKIERITREIEVVRADMTQLSAINQVSQTFHARLLLVMRMPDGASDKDLVKEYDGFPLDSNGRTPSHSLEPCAPPQNLSAATYQHPQCVRRRDGPCLGSSPLPQPSARPCHAVRSDV